MPGAEVTVRWVVLFLRGLLRWRAHNPACIFAECLVVRPPPPHGPPPLLSYPCFPARACWYAIIDGLCVPRVQSRTLLSSPRSLSELACSLSCVVMQRLMSSVVVALCVHRSRSLSGAPIGLFD